MTKLRWYRRSPESQNNFDLILENPQDVNGRQLNQLLDLIHNEKHRKLTLSARAVHELRQLFSNPGRPLSSVAYVLLSNWFMTQSGDRNSLVASHCEALWDALFSCRPPERLSSPAAGQNHLIVPLAFDAFWRRLRQAQGEVVAPRASEANDLSQSVTSDEPERFASKRLEDIAEVALTSFTEPEHIATSPPSKPNPYSLRTVITVNGMRCEVQGSAEDVAQLLRMLSAQR